MKKIISIISVITLCFITMLNYLIPIRAEDGGSGCNVCGLDSSIQDGEDETLNYTDEERALVMESIENSQIYKEHLDIIQNSDRINVFKNKKTNSLGRPKEFEIDYKERYEILKKFLTFIKAQRKKK